MKAAQEESFRQFVEGSWSRLLRTAYLLTGDHGAAEDLVQTALMRTYRHWGRIEAYESPEAYVRRVMVNTNISAWRRRKAVVHVMAEPPEPMAGVGAGSGSGTTRTPTRSATNCGARSVRCRRGCARRSSCATSRT